VFVIGGGQMYRYFLDKAKVLYVTRIHHVYPADTHFPEFSERDFTVIEHESVENDPVFPYRYDFLTYQRNLVSSG